MNKGFLGFALGLLVASTQVMAASDFGGATPQPIGRVKESVAQLRIQFPAEIAKTANQEAFKVTCLPAVKGTSGWADNNTIWTYDFQAPTEYQSPRLVGGSKCQITQTSEVKSTDGKAWAAGSINYSVEIAGPNVLRVIPAHGFQGSLREVEPIVLIMFDGPVDPTRFFAEQNGYFNYTSANAPSEKLALAPIPQDQAERIFGHFKQSDYSEVNFSDRTWILATTRQNLIPGAQINLTIENQASADNSDVRAGEKFVKDFSVRSQFQAEVRCANPSANGTCLPKSQISVELNGMVKWADIKDAYIEYIPYESKDNKTVRSFAEIDENREIGFWDDLINMLSVYFPFLAKYSDTVLDQVVFNVNVEPQTQARVVLPENLVDLDGRRLSNVLAEFHIRIGAMTEVVRMPKTLSFFEKNFAEVFLPVGVVNQNQTLKIRKSGADSQSWTPIRDVTEMIRVIRAYASRGDYRETPEYTSPLDQLGVPSNVVEQKMTGVKNRPTVLQFPFASKGVKPSSGLYAMEVSSPAYEKDRSDEENYFNPKYTLAQVTDLSIHLKKGQESTLAWVTQLSNAQPVAGATVDIFNCLGEKVLSVTTDNQGLATFKNQKWSNDCRSEDYSEYSHAESYFAAVSAGDDLAVVHSSWLSSNTWALGAPGIEWFWSEIRENEPNFHAVIGVNLVKPGQKVPVELLAKIPNAKGFAEVPAAQLPTSAKVISSDDNKIYYEFPLTWSNGRTAFEWTVPSDSSVQLGQYQIELVFSSTKTQRLSSDIEVAEFKIPLMSGIIAFPNQELVKPDSIPVNAVIRYANGVGAKKLPASFSYYFAPTSITNKDLPNFTFGTGALSLQDDKVEVGELPSNTRPAVIEGLATSEDGSLSKDVALERAADGRTISEVLKSVERPQKLVVRVRYQDQIGEYQTLSQAKNIYNAQTYVGTNLIAGGRAEARLQAAVVDVKSQIVTDPADLEIKVVRIETRVIGEELFGGLIKNTLEREVKPVRWVQNCALEKKALNCQVGALKEGSYAFQVTSKTSKQAAHQLFKVDGQGRVYGPNDYYGFGDDEGSRQMPLALNKETFKNGEKAVVSFSAPFKTCNALVTLERSNVISSFISNGACEKGQVEVPVDSTLAPNAFVSVYAITGRAENSGGKVGEVDLGRPTYRLGYANMKVNWGRFKSVVTVKTDKEKYEPGQTVNVAINVKAEEGTLGATTVTLVALEEKILELKKNDSYSVLSALMKMRGHEVLTVTALEKIETMSAGNADLPGAEDDGGRKGGDEGGDGSSRSDFKRKLFDALVTFKTGIPVVNGVAQYSFKANDSLTRFKVFAIATSETEKFGTGEAVYISEKETQSYSNIPTVAHTGDAYPLKVTVQNNSGRAAKFRAEVTATIKDKNGKVIGTKTLSKEATIDKSASQAIDLGQIEIGEDDARIEYVIRIVDENGKIVDVMEPEAQTILASVPLAIHDTLIAQVENGSLTKLLAKDAAALQGRGEIRVLASKSLVSGAVTQIAQRIDQDMFADFFIASRFNRALLRSTEAKPQELQAVLDAMIGYTDEKGFVKYYPQASRGSVFLTADILNALSREPWAMKFVPASLAAKLKEASAAVLTKSAPAIYIGKTEMDWLRAQVAMGQSASIFGDTQLVAAARAVNATITETLKRDPNFYGAPVEKWSTRDLVDSWLLEVAVDSTTAGSSDFLKQLLSPARMIYAGNTAKLSGQPTRSMFYSDETIETARLLQGFAAIRGDKVVAKSLALGLVSVNTKGWYNLQTMADVVGGLKGFARSYEMEVVTGNALISVPEEKASATVDFSKTTASGLKTNWASNQATVQVTHAGQGQPWVSVQALSAIPLKVSRGQGLSIKKEVRNLNRETGDQAGDIIEVTIEVRANSSMQDIAVFDPIPAGSNIVGEASGAYSTSQKSYAGLKFYFSFLDSGATTVKYQYQLNNPGKFKLPPTRAEGLFETSLFAESPNATVEVR